MQVGGLDIPQDAYDDAIDSGSSHQELDLLISTARVSRQPREVHKINSGCPMSAELEYIIPKAIRKLLDTVLDHTNATYESHFEILNCDPLTQEGRETVPGRGLKTSEDMEELERVINLVKACKAAVNESCGLHVHSGIDHLDPDKYGLKISAADFQLEVMKRVLVNYYSVDTSQYTSPSGIHPLRQGEHANQARSVLKARNVSYDVFVNEIFAAKSYEELLKVASPSPPVTSGLSIIDKEYAVNLNAFEKFGTIEFRQHAGTLESQEVLHWMNTIDDLMTLSIKQAVEDCKSIEKNISPVTHTAPVALDSNTRHTLQHTDNFLLAPTFMAQIVDAQSVQEIFAGKNSRGI